MILATAAQMKEMDRIAIEELGIPSLDLMERAAEGIAAAVAEVAEERAEYLPDQAGESLCGEVCTAWEKRPEDARRAMVFAGMGNNGGDGVAAARLLAERGWEVSVVLVGDRAKMTADTAAMERKLQEAGVRTELFSHGDAFLSSLLARCAMCDVFVDALFGVGLCREVGGDFASVIALMNSCAQTPVVAADIASGLSADSGKVLGCAVRAAVTVTFSLAKIGQFADQGSLYTGKLIVHDIGIPQAVIDGQKLLCRTIDAPWVQAHLPRRPADGHKGTFGKDYVLAGSVGFTGAPVFAGRACVRSGAGLVTIGTPASAWGVVAGKCMEEMPYPLPERDGKVCAAAYDAVMEKMSGCSAVLIGPGLGRGAESDALICRCVEETPQPLVLDADGINAVGAHIDSLRRRMGRATVVTPHDGEFARLGGDLENRDRVAAAREFAAANGCVLVLKGHRTIVAAPDGRIAVNTTGNSGMAKGGSGDVLSGMILSLLGQGMAAFEAACAAVWLHGRAGDLAAAELGEYAMTPSDLLEHLPAAFGSIF